MAVTSPARTFVEYKWRVVAMLWTISFFNYADRAALFTLFPLLEHEMHLSNVQLGLVYSRRFLEIWSIAYREKRRCWGAYTPGV
jgi:hypothetical protein